jgi:hypothetical protein
VHNKGIDRYDEESSVKGASQLSEGGTKKKVNVPFQFIAKQICPCSLAFLPNHQDRIARPYAMANNTPAHLEI